MTNAELLQEFAKFVRIISSRAMSAAETKEYIRIHNEILKRMGGRNGTN